MTENKEENNKKLLLRNLGIEILEEVIEKDCGKIQIKKHNKTLTLAYHTPVNNFDGKDRKNMVLTGESAKDGFFGCLAIPIREIKAEILKKRSKIRKNLKRL